MRCHSQTSQSLICLAEQLGSPDDRRQYTKVILKKEHIQTQIETLQTSLQLHCQQNQLETSGSLQKIMTLPPTRAMPRSSSTFQPTARRSMSSFSLHLSKSASMYQPQLEEYESDLGSQRQIDRLSKQYKSSNAIHQLLKNTTTLSPTAAPAAPAESVTGNSVTRIRGDCSPLEVKTSNLQHHSYQALPLSPPLSPPTSSLYLTCSSSTNATTTTKSRSLTFSSFTSTTSTSSSTLSHGNTNAKSVVSPFLPSMPISPPSSPTSSSHINDDCMSGTDDDSKCQLICPAIVHIPKNNGRKLRSFLGRSVLLNKSIRMEHQCSSTDPRFYDGKDLISDKSKYILKLTIIKSPSSTSASLPSSLSSKKNVIHHHPQKGDSMANFGIHFLNTALFSVSSSSNGSAANMNKYASIPDSLILEALHVWMKKSYLPPLARASHIIREGMKLYIVFDSPLL